jgi:DNA topoisomerase-1
MAPVDRLRRLRYRVFGRLQDGRRFGRAVVGSRLPTAEVSRGGDARFGDSAPLRGTGLVCAAATAVNGSEQSAHEADLRYVSDQRAGITRRKSGDGFVYFDPRGRRIRDQATLARIRSLVIPPAWEDVWICPRADGHLQATGRDVRGRKQYRYHPRWQARRDAEKFDRVLAFAHALPAIRQRVTADLRQPPLSRDRVLATVVRLLEATLIRVGNDEYARTNGSFGLTTLEDRHVDVNGSHITFRFRAKSGVYQRIELQDAQLARSVKRCRDVPGQRLFQYLDAEGRRQSVESGDVNEYLRRITGQDFTAKDFRTWAATVLAACALKAAVECATASARKKALVAAIDSVADKLGNTRAVCRKAYIHPAIMNSYLEGATINGTPLRRSPDTAARLTPDEAAVVAFLAERGRPADDITDVNVGH